MVKTHVAYAIAVKRKYTADLDWNMFVVPLLLLVSNTHVNRDFWSFHLDVLRMFDQQLFQRILLLLFLKKLKIISEVNSSSCLLY
jgi:hypothetical protein